MELRVMVTRSDSGANELDFKSWLWHPQLCDLGSVISLFVFQAPQRKNQNKNLPGVGER